MKEVKIIGLRVDHQLGILKSCDLKFSEDNNLVAIKGEVGAGKTTLQRSLKLGTQGSNSLKDDKKLYGEVDQEVELLDGETSIFVGCKSDEEGAIKYVLYSKDSNGKKITNPVIDGVKCTPSTYLKDLQTSLTWKMNELTSENQTVQRNILMELYKHELERVGVIFDKSSGDYSSSVLGRLDMAIEDRTGADILRKRMGGLTGDLKSQGYDVENKESLPSRIDLSTIRKQISIKEFNITNIEEGAKNKRDSELSELKAKAKEITRNLKELNFEIKQSNTKKELDYKTAFDKFKSKGEILQETTSNIEKLYIQDGYIRSDADYLITEIRKLVCNEQPKEIKLDTEIPFDDDKIGVVEDLTIFNEEVQTLILDLFQVRKEFSTLFNESVSFDTSSLVKDLEILKMNEVSAIENNKICDAIESFNKWHEADLLVREIRGEYISLLENINTGVEGLKINFDKEDEKMGIYLSYDGSYDTNYFNNPNKEFRKLSSYSGTQKPMIALLVQNYLLSRKEKAMRYIWIDDVPIDLKTQGLLREMANKLNLTVFVNITGDFDKDTIKSGEVLIEGGEVFFKF